MSAPAIRLFSTDLDGTLLGNPAACWRFCDTWNAMEPGRRPLLVFNTARTVAATLAIVSARELPQPDYIIGSIGTELHSPGSAIAAEFVGRLTSAWDLAAIERIVSTTTAATRQPDEFQNPFKSSWHWVRAQREELQALRARLSAEGLNAHLDYAGRYFLSIVPRAAGKGNGLSWLCQRLGISFQGVLVAGDTGHDTSMFPPPGIRGIVLENSRPKRGTAVTKPPVFTAAGETADGVIEARLVAVFRTTEPDPART